MEFLGNGNAAEPLAKFVPELNIPRLPILVQLSGKFVPCPSLSHFALHSSFDATTPAYSRRVEAIGDQGIPKRLRSSA
jgi:hypothetical protein